MIKALLNPLRILLLAQLLMVFIVALAKSATTVALAVLRPVDGLRSSVIAVPTDLRTDLGIATLANLISLTPGTTSLHVSEDRKTIYVHALDAGSDEEVVRDIKQTFEGLIRRIENA